MAAQGKQHVGKLWTIIRPKLFNSRICTRNSDILSPAMGGSIVLSTSLELGQLTFILRVVIQILSYGGVTLISLILVAHAPRVTTIETHDVINRLVGSATMTLSTLRWLFGTSKRSRRPPMQLIAVIWFAISYAAFVAVSDIGILGLKSCQVGGPNTQLRPASITSHTDAQALITSNMINGTNPNSIGAHRCGMGSPNPTSPTSFDCVAGLSNSSYGDDSFWRGINTTDTDVLMPRRMKPFGKGAVGGDPSQLPSNDAFYQFGPSNTRLEVSAISNGLAMFPNATGISTVLGVPDLQIYQSIFLKNTMVLDIEFGCMSTGIYSQDDGAQGFVHDLFRTDDEWRTFTGPEYMREPLAASVDSIRSLLQPNFNATPSSLYTEDYEGLLEAPSRIFDASGYPAVGHVKSWLLPGSVVGKDRYISDAQVQLLRDCSNRLLAEIGPSDFLGSDNEALSCGLIGLGGAFENGVSRFSRMVCATSTQLRLASVKISTDKNGTVDLAVMDVTPSQLHHTKYNPDALSLYDRYTLSPSSLESNLSHFILTSFTGQETNTGTTNGDGSVGSILPRIGNAVLDPSGSFSTDIQYSGISLLHDSLKQIQLTPGVITQWAGQVAGSFIRESISMNGWAILDSKPIDVISTGGSLGICYKPIYALGFLPLLISAIIVIVWSIVLLFKSSLNAADNFKASYGGLGPYTSAICPEAADRDTLLVWENTPQPSLHVLPKGAPILGDRNSTALEAIRSGSPYTTYQFTPYPSDEGDYKSVQD